MNLFKDDYNLKKIKLITTKGTGLKMYIAPRYIDHYVKNEYELFSSEIIKNYLKPHSTFVDVGAHYGYYSLLVHQLQQNIKIIAVEPVKENFEILNKNIKLNKIKNVKTYQFAISNKVGLKQFNISEASDSAGFYNHPLAATLKKIKVKAITLDQLLKNQKIDFIKIDTEGHELEILDGMKDVLNKNREIKIVIEFNPKCLRSAGHHPEDLLRKIDSLGFEIYLIKDKERQIYRLTNQLDNWSKMMDDLSSNNLFCLPKKRSLFVTFFSHTGELGGSELSLLELINELIEKDVLIQIILPSIGPLKKILDKKPVYTEIVPYGWWTREDTIPNEEKIAENSQAQYNLLNFLPKLKSFNPDVIYTNTVSIPWGAVVSILLGKPHIWHIREYGKTDHNLHFDLGEEEAKKFINLASNAVITNSNSIKNFYKDFIDEKKMTTVYNYIAIPKKLLRETVKTKIFYSKNSTKLLILGTIMPSKGQMDAILAIHQLLKKKYNLELSILGQIANEKYAKNIKKYIKDNKLEKNIHLHKFVSNPYPIINCANIVLTCSVNEAFGRATVEAMLLKKAVIGTRSGGTVELIKDKYNGLLYNPQDYKDLAEKIEYLLINKNRIKEFGKNGYEFVRKNVPKENYGGKIYQILQKVKKEKSILQNYTPFFYSLYLALDKVLTKQQDLETQLNTLNSQNTQLSQQLSQKTQETETLKKQVEKIVLLIDTVKSNNEIYKQQIDEFNSLTKILKEEMERKKTKIEELKIQLKKTERDKNQRIKQLERKLKGIEKEQQKRTNELENENESIRQQIEQTKAHIQNLEATLNNIKSAKFFRLWQGYCKIMKFLKLKS